MNESKGNDALRVMLWGVPRSASTVFAKFMSFVDNVEVWHEPYVLSFVNESGWIADRQALLALTKPLYDMYPEDKRGNLRPINNFCYESARESLEKVPTDPSTKFIFVKDMAFAINGHFEFIPQKVPVKHVFLIRHPHRYLSSNRSHIMKMVMKSSYDPSDDVIKKTGENEMLKLWKHVRENIDPNSPVVDSDQYLQAPEKVIPKLFAEIGIPWKDSYLSWDKSEDIITTWNGSLEQIFADKVLQSKMFRRAFESGKFVAVDKAIPEREELHPDVVPLVDKYMPGYEEMSKHLLQY